MVTNPFKQLVKDKGFLQVVNRSTYDTNREFVTSGLWDIEFTKVPDAVFFPGNEAISSRIRSVSPPDIIKSELMRWDHRGFRKYQPNSRIIRDGKVTLEFTDYEDQTITAFLNSWSVLQSDPQTNLGLRSEFTKCDLLLTRYNTSGNAINQIICKSGFLSASSFNNDYSNEQNLIASQKFTLEFEHCELKLLNV